MTSLIFATVLSGVTLSAHAEEVPAHRLQAPGPLEPRPFQLPVAQTAQLSNGVDVLVVENHEVPLIYINVVVRSGTATDPVEREGLASVTLDMMDEGAGERSAEALSVAGRKLGASVGTFSSLDYAGTSLEVLGRNLEPGLDLLADVTLRPTFPVADWEIMQKRRVQNLAASKADPNSVATRIFSRLMHGDSYAGRLLDAAAYEAITTEQMVAWHGAHMRPEDAIILVGGDTDLDSIVPLLEARFGAWSAASDAPAALDLDADLPEHPPGTVYLHDIEGAAQSIIRMGTFVMGQQDPSAASFLLANRAFGGQFMSRLNLNLREDKGWTYGARSSIGHSERPGMWVLQTSVVTPTTASSIEEAFRELDGLTEGGESTSGEAFGPLSQAELDQVRDGLLYTWPLSFENPSFLLRERLQMWRYGLAEDWLSAYPDRMRSVALDGAVSSWADHVSKEGLLISVVGDAAVVRPGIEELGLTVVMVDADGNAITE
jgi:zinc protease